jgi:hypothetical protein
VRRSGIHRLETRLLSVRHDGQDVRLLTPPASQGGSDAQIQDRVIDWLPDEADQVLVERPPDSRRLEPSVCRLDTTSGRFTVVHPAERQVLHWMTDPQQLIVITGHQDHAAVFQSGGNGQPGEFYLGDRGETA